MDGTEIGEKRIGIKFKVLKIVTDTKRKRPQVSSRDKLLSEQIIRLNLAISPVK